MPYRTRATTTFHQAAPEPLKNEAAGVRRSTSRNNRQTAPTAKPFPGSVVHSLGHGRLAITTGPICQKQAQLQLIWLFNAKYGGTLLFPNPDMPYSVSART